LAQRERRRAWAVVAVILTVALGLAFGAGCGRQAPEPPATLAPTRTDSGSHLPAPAAEAVPLVVSYTPDPMQELTDGSPIVVRFDRRMDRERTQAAFHLFPEVQGEFEWVNDRELHFVPRSLTAGVRYEVVIDSSAASLDGAALAGEFRFFFVSREALQVTRVTPSDKAVGVRSDQALLIAFGSPVVPEACVGVRQLDGSTCPIPVLSLTPAVVGTGTWLNSAIYRFVPTGGWALGRTYEAALEPQQFAVGGAALAQQISWRFTTTVPVIVAVSPRAEERHVAPSSAIELSFSTPMDREMTGSAFSLVDESGKPVSGALVWGDGGAQVVFTPATELAMGSWYTATLGARARAAGSMPLDAPLVWRFRTVELPQVLGILPADGEAASAEEPVRIRLEGDIDQASLVARVTISPSVASGSVQAYYDVGERVYTLSWDKVPGSETCVSLLPGVRDLYGNTIDQGAMSCFRVRDLDAVLVLAQTPNHVVLSVEAPPVLTFRARNVGAVDFSLYRLDELAYIRGEEGEGDLLRAWSSRPQDAPNVLQQWQVMLSSRGERLPLGYYRLRWNVAVVDSHASLWVARDAALVWATSLSTGQPVTRTAVRLVDAEGLLVAGGTTDPDGIARIPISQRPHLWDRLYAIIGDPDAGLFGVSGTHWQAEGVTDRVMDVPVDYVSVSPTRGYLVVNPESVETGQEIALSGLFVSADAGQDRDLPHLSALHVSIRDPLGTTIYSEEESLSAVGALDSAVRLPGDALAGVYTVTAWVDEAAGATRWLATFTVRAPVLDVEERYVVNVIPGARDLVLGDVLSATVQVYGWNGPVAVGTPLSWTLWVAPPKAEVTDGWTWDSCCGPASSSGAVASGTALIGEWGISRIRIPTRSLREGVCAGHTELVLVVRLADTGEEGRAPITLHPAGLRVGLLARDRVVPSSGRSAASVAVRDWLGQPVVDQIVELTIARRSWRLDSDGFGGTWIYSDTVVLAQTLETDATGQAMIPFAVSGAGSFVLSARARDANGRVVEAQVLLWAGGATSGDWQLDRGALGLMPDKAGYQVGEEAALLVMTPYADVSQVLVVVQGEGILTHQRFEVSGSNPVINVPVLAEYAPGVYLSVAAIPAASAVEDAGTAPASVGLVPLEVASREEQLTLDLAADRAMAEPGDPLTLLLRATDGNGLPVGAQISVVALEQSSPVTLTSPLAASVSALRGPGPWRVAMGDSLAEDSAEPWSSTPSWSADAAIDPTLSPSVLWLGAVTTDELGVAHLSFTLPDDYAEWRLIAVAADAAGRLGVAETTVRAERELSMTPLGPAVLSPGDNTWIGVVLRNHTLEPMDLQMRLESDASLTTESALQEVRVQPLSLASVAWPVRIERAAGDSVTVTLGAEALRYGSFGPLSTTLSIRIRPETPPTVLRFAGSVGGATGERLETFWIPEVTVAESRLSLRVDDAPVSVIGGGLSYLSEYPYASTDVLVSRLHAAVHAGRAYRVANVLSTELSDPAQRLARDSVDQLCARQNPDGGWGWWRGASDLKLTSLGVIALVEAEESGLSVCSTGIASGGAFLAETLAAAAGNAGNAYAHRAMAVFALTVAGQLPPAGSMSDVYALRESLGVIGQSYLALALARVDSSDPRIASLVESVRRQALVRDDGVCWLQSDNVCWEADTSATAMVVRMMLELAPDDPLIPQAVNWLLSARSGDHWGHPSLTSSVLIALSRYAEQQESSGISRAGSPCGWSVILNGDEVAAGTECGPAASLWSPGSYLAELQGLPAGLNAVRIVADEGAVAPLTYSIEVATYPEESTVAGRGRGLMLWRSFCPAGSVLTGTGCTPDWTGRSGEEVSAVYTLILSKPVSYLVLEDEIAHGWVPESLSVVGDAYDLCIASAYASVGSPPQTVCRAADHAEVAAGKMAFFYSNVPAGVYQVVVPLHAGTLGVYAAPAASTYAVYPAAMIAYSAPAQITVLP